MTSLDVGQRDPDVGHIAMLADPAPEPVVRFPGPNCDASGATITTGDLQLSFVTIAAPQGVCQPVSIRSSE
ncbi:hypothetical protein [Streptomyces sp. NPDC054794]